MMTKKKKTILWISLAAGVLAVAAAVFLLFSFRQEEPMVRLVKLESLGEEPAYIVENGLDPQAVSAPQPCYSFDAPPGYIQTRNAQESANRFSTTYTDRYQTELGGVLEFSQVPADSQWRKTLSGTFREIKVGDLTVVCCHKNDFSGVDSSVFWVYGNRVLTISADWTMDDNQLLELVDRVEYDVLREPVYSSLEFHYGSFEPDSENHLSGQEYDYQRPYITGNPKLPEEILYYGFASSPEGFVLNERLSQTDAVQGIWTEVYYRDASGQREQLTLNCFTGREKPVFENIDLEQMGDRSLIQEVSVQGTQGWYYQGEDGAELVFLTDYLIVQLSFEGGMTQPELLSLAESLVQKPAQESYG